LDDEMIYRQARHFGCVAYLRKPFSADQLIDAIVKAGQTLRRTAPALQWRANVVPGLPVT
jgi:FixJ family two-component response regulator